MGLSFAVHIVAIVMWVGGLMLATRIFTLLIKGGATPALLAPAASRMTVGFIIPGLLLTVASGVYQIMLKGAAFYMKQGWFHTKLTLVLVLVVMTVLFIVQSNKLKGGVIPRTGLLMMIHGISALSLVIIAILTFSARV